jgi:hypothetical protein
MYYIYLGWAHDNIVNDVQINNVLGNIREVPSVKENGVLAVDSAGAIVRIIDIVNTTDGTYMPDRLHDLRFSLGYYKSAAHGNDPTLVSFAADPVLKARFGTFKIGGHLSNWAVNGGDIQTLFDDGTLVYHCNADAMNHIQKGVVGLFVQDALRTTIRDVSIHNVVNYGLDGTDLCGSYGKFLMNSNQFYEYNKIYI